MVTLSLGEDLCLLLLDDATGDLRPLQGRALDFGFAAGVLLELSRHGRIAVEDDRLDVVDASPVDDPVADPELAEIASSKECRSPEFWVQRLGLESGSQIARACLDRLVERGIVERLPGGLFFCVADLEHSQSHCTDLGAVANEVRIRVMRTLLHGEKAEPSDVTLIQLANACGAFETILSAAELAEAKRGIKALGPPQGLCEVAARVTAGDLAARKPKREEHEPIPEVPGLPILGNALSMTGEVQPYLDTLYRKYGPIFGIRIPGQRIVVMGGKEAIAFAEEHSQTRLRSDEAFSPICHAAKTDRLLIASDGYDHIKLRRSAHSMYASASVEDNLPQLVDIARSVLSSWHATKSVSVYSAMQELLILQIGALTFGRSLAEHVDGLRHWNDSLIIAMRRDRPKFLVERRLRKVRPQVERLFREALEEHDPHLRAGCPRDVIDDVVDMHRRHPEFISESDLLHAVITPYIQSLDQIACALGIALLHLLAERRYAERCQAEADEAFASGSLSIEGIGGLHMTRALIAEVMRLHGTTPILLRTARESFEFEGHWVPAGTTLWLAIAVVHGDPEYYRDADKFEPERHLPPRRESQPEGAYVPFGIGPHSCLGREFSSDLMAVNMATMLRFADVDRFPAKDRRVRITPYPHLRPRARCRIQIKPLRDA